MKTSELFNLNDKVVLVTGGAAGIGKACAFMLGNQGAHICIADYNQQAAEETVKEFTNAGIKAIAVRCNVLEDLDLVHAVEETVRQLGNLHILINNAGDGGGGLENPFKTDVADIRRDFEFNVFSGWRFLI